MSALSVPSQEYYMILKLDTTITPIYTHSLDEFNSYVENYKTDEQIILTKSNNISQETLRHLPASKTWKRGNHMEFQYIDGKQHIRVLYALHYDEQSEMDNKIAYEALNYFKGLMEVIPTDDVEPEPEFFTCEENKESAYYNYVNNRYINMTLNHCYSLDRNNSFPASMLEEYPQTRPWVEKYYKERLLKKGKPGYERFKVYGSIFIGWLNNPKYHRSHAWKRIVSNSNKKVHQLRQFIEKQGNEVLLVNTDAVKFIGHVSYNESTNLGDFKYEWQDTKMYIKGVKSYAYLDKDKWKFKQAGKCKLDSLKPREQWTLDEFKNMDCKIAHIKINKEGKLVEVFE